MRGELMRVDPRFKRFVKEVRKTAEADGVILSEREITEMIEKFLKYTVQAEKQDKSVKRLWENDLFG